MKKTLIYWLSLLLILVMVNGCSTRKVVSKAVKKESYVENLEIEKKDLKVKDNSNVIITNEVIRTDETTTEKKTYAPVDPTKSSSFTDDKGNRKELNNTLYTEEKTSSETNKKGTTKTEYQTAKTTIDKGVKSNSTNTKTKEATKGKNTSRFSFSWWWLILLLIPIGFYLFKRFKDKIWWI